MQKAFLPILLWATIFALASTTEVLFLISSQEGSQYHRQLSVNLRSDILQQSKALTTTYGVNAHLLHEIFDHPGDWTLLSTLAHLQDTTFTPTLINNNTKWIIICKETTRIDLHSLLLQLTNENHTKPLFLGYPLYDQEATIVHHFAFFENPKWFPYPLLHAGVILSISLLNSLAAAITGEGVARGARPPTRRTEFSIDAAHELARFIFENVRIDDEARLDEADSNINNVEIDAAATKVHHEQPNLGESIVTSFGTTTEPNHFKNVRKIILQEASYICPKAHNKSQINLTNGDKMHKGISNVTCTMYAKPMATNSTLCSFFVRHEQIFVAIKTCQRFHKERIPIIEATWAPNAIHRRYYSDVEDASIPTINTGVPNVETGHCEKTLTILKLALKEIEQLNQQLLRSEMVDAAIRWLLLSDDDTLLSISRLCDFLSCFNHTDTIYLGERYGYRLHAKDGFNYITGGGGIVLSLPTVSLIVKHCSCPTTTSPDDMILGACLHTLGIKAIHTSRFHQARPNDYPRELLEIEPPISFHKFWQLVPQLVYNQWFAAEDRQMLRSELNRRTKQESKLLAHLKMMSTIRNKSRYPVGSTLHCERNQNSEAIKSSIETANNLALASFEHESGSHFDL